jgi:hypothetical protein
MRYVIGWLLDLVCRASGHRWCCTWVGRTSFRWMNGGK